MQVIIDMKWITDEIERLKDRLQCSAKFTVRDIEPLSMSEMYRLQGELIALERLKKKIEES